MKLKITAALFILAAGGAVVGTLIGDDGKPVDVSPVASDEMRAIKIDGPCPEAGPTQEAAKCEGGSWSDSKGGCLCLTRQEAGKVDGEIDKADDLTPAKRNLLVVCPNPKGPKEQPSVSWSDGSKELPRDCLVAAKSMIDTTIGDVETDLVAQLREACRPCEIRGSSWGSCPRCLLAEGGCARACPSSAEVPSP